MKVLYTKAGNSITFSLETVYNTVRQDSTSLPIIKNIYLPDLSLSAGFPQNMVKISAGLYTFTYDVPVYASSVGDLIIDISYQEPVTDNLLSTVYQVVVKPIYGLSGGFGFHPTTYPS